MSGGFLRIFFLGLVENDLAAVRALLRERLDPRARTLDLGCGPGLFADVFADGDYVGVDPDPAAVDQARKTRPGTFLCEDLARTELPDARFDQALAFDLLGRESDARAMAILGEARRLTKPRGRMLMVDRAHSGDRIARLCARIGHVDQRIPRRSGLRRRVAVLLTT
jgi:SAM-dependent methyltransferase